MRKPLFDKVIFQERRKKLAKLCKKGDALVVFSGAAPRRSNDTHYTFRVHSDFFYLTGFEEENAVLIFRPGANPETVVFTQKKDPHFETWEGFLFGPEAAKTEFGFDQTHLFEDFESKAYDYLAEVDQIFYRLGDHESSDRLMISVAKRVLRSKGRKGLPLQTFSDPGTYLSPMRLIKSDLEVDLLRTSGEIASRGHEALIKQAKPGKTERELQGLFVYEIMKRGARGEAYNSIVASGPNATTLHYVFNDCEIQDGDLILVDAGAEYHYMASDITRTFPANGKFKPFQAEVYSGLLAVQKKLIDMVVVGASFKELNDHCCDLLASFMKDLGLFKESLDEINEKKLYKKFYPHGVGHYLGIDVHDAGFYESGDEPIRFQENVALTIEPGIYVPLDAENVPKEFKGLGIRIEDDILVTKNGPEILTASCPKEIHELEN